MGFCWNRCSFCMFSAETNVACCALDCCFCVFCCHKSYPCILFRIWRRSGSFADFLPRTVLADFLLETFARLARDYCTVRILIFCRSFIQQTCRFCVAYDVLKQVRASSSVLKHCSFWGFCRNSCSLNKLFFLWEQYNLFVLKKYLPLSSVVKHCW